MTGTLITNLEKLLGGPRDGALLRYSLGSEYLKAGNFEQAASSACAKRSTATPAIQPPGSCSARHSAKAGKLPKLWPPMNRGSASPKPGETCRRPGKWAFCPTLRRQLARDEP
jgi:hypothetical protein